MAISATGARSLGFGQGGSTAVRGLSKANEYVVGNEPSDKR